MNVLLPGQNSSLKLRYAFIPNPNPITASVESATPKTVNLKIIITNPTMDPIAFQQIAIQIPIGENVAKDLSNVRDLPAPTYALSDNCSIRSEGDRVIIEPKNKEMKIAGGSIYFELKNIQINEKAGVVAITITESNPPTPKVTDSTTYSLIKQVADFPVISFYADPALLTDISNVMLHWQTDSIGESYLYNAYCASSYMHWSPMGNCIIGGACYGANDGLDGIATPELSQDTIFGLEVIKTTSEGRKSVATIYTQVNIEVPTISPYSYIEDFKLFNGRLLSLHWLANNTRQCDLSIRNETIEEVDKNTYQAGYLIFINGAKDAYPISLKAFAATGSLQISFSFQTTYIDSDFYKAEVMTPDLALCSIATTASGELALGMSKTNNLQAKIVFFETKDNKLLMQKKLDAGSYPNAAIAITPDGKLGFIMNSSANKGNYLSVINIESYSIEANIIALSTNSEKVYSIAITPDGKLALVACMNCIMVIDIAKRQKIQEISNDGINYCIAITPDGKYAFIGNSSKSVINILDIKNLTIEDNPTKIVNGMPIDIAITSNGNFIVVVINAMAKGHVVIMDAKSRQIIKTLPMQGSPIKIAVTPNGRLGLVVSRNPNCLNIIDLQTPFGSPRFQAAQKTMPLANGYVGVATMADNKNALITTSESGKLGMV